MEILKSRADFGMEGGAKFAWGMWTRLAKKSLDHRLPMKPDLLEVVRKAKGPSFPWGLQNLIGRRPTLPPTCAGSTIGAEGLNFRVRDGNGCDPLATITQKLVSSLTL